MRYPPFLKKGDTIGVSAPSLCITEPTDINRMNNAVSKLEERGYILKITDDVISRNGDAYTPVGMRVSEYESLFLNDSVRYIVSAKGGDTQCEMLDKLDWDMMKDHPKWIQGYSDNTNIVLKYAVDCDVASVYGSNFGDYGMEPWFRSVEENMEFMEGIRTSQCSFPFHESSMGTHGDGLEPVREETPTEWHCSCGDVTVEGRLIGGCMDVIKDMLGSDSIRIKGFVDRYSSDGIIWFMETYDMSKEAIEKLFVSMKEEHLFDSIRAFVFGRPLFYDGDYEKDVIDMLSDLKVPLIFGADVGHLAPRMTFINGAVAEFRISDKRCELRYNFK